MYYVPKWRTVVVAHLLWPLVGMTAATVGSGMGRLLSVVVVAHVGGISRFSAAGWFHLSHLVRTFVRWHDTSRRRSDESFLYQRSGWAGSTDRCRDVVVGPSSGVSGGLRAHVSGWTVLRVRVQCDDRAVVDCDHGCSHADGIR